MPPPPPPPLWDTPDTTESVPLGTSGAGLGVSDGGSRTGGGSEGGDKGDGGEGAKTKMVEIVGCDGVAVS